MVQEGGDDQPGGEDEDRDEVVVGQDLEAVPLKGQVSHGIRFNSAIRKILPWVKI